MGNDIKKKLRPECTDCRYLIGKDPAKALCKKGNVPTCIRKRRTCSDKAFVKKKAVAYTDGSYNQVTKRYGTGVCLYADGRKHPYTESGDDAEGGRQVLGEIRGALKACEMALEMGCTELEIRYDYEGVEAWAMGFWKTNRDYTQKYAGDMKEYMKKLKISFTHVRAHHGETGNEHADSLAKKACGMIENEKKRKSHVPSIPEGVNGDCRKAIEDFYKKKNPTFRDYMVLKTYGSDEFSKKGFTELKSYMAGHKPDDIREKLGDDADGKDYCACVRWMMRGLTREDAIRKVQVDIEMRKNTERRNNNDNGGM